MGYLSNRQGNTPTFRGARLKDRRKAARPARPPESLAFARVRLGEVCKLLCGRYEGFDCDKDELFFLLHSVAAAVLPQNRIKSIMAYIKEWAPHLLKKPERAEKLAAEIASSAPMWWGSEKARGNFASLWPSATSTTCER
jgi:hypothetical protein